MFRAYIAQNSRCIASSTSSNSHSLLHTSSILHAAPKKRMTNKVKQERRAQRYERANLNRPSPILGTRPGEEMKWDECDLARILVKEDELATPPKMTPTERPIGVIHEPQQYAFAITKTEADELFGKLPILSSQISPRAVKTIGERRAGGGGIAGVTGGSLTSSHTQAMIAASQESGERELRKANLFAKVVDLRNADADGIAYENRRRIIEAFSGPENPFDPGRTEVQAAILTYRIRNLWNHLTKFKRDVGNRRGLRKLVHQRAKVLKYLKRTDRERYDVVLERLALEPASVEGELVV
ncbi:S15/NS1 RNA-binding domain-containing protein [Marasmius fiardii PR-910]|nr:S15/NS1 RNA-binding domain-containing protein [Marasmius fiardii PR-910]